MKFTITAKDSYSNARCGVFSTDHGMVQTPIFMPVGTAATVKAVHFSELHEQIKAEIILSNTYHLYLRPGNEVLETAGGVHAFMGWNKPVLTDSGGYQVFSLAQRRKLSEEGAKFSSHLDGSTHLFTPESVMDIQRIIGADIIMAFDECPPYPCDYLYAKKSMELTHRWLNRCCTRFDQTEPKYGYSQSLFPIVQGSVFRDLRAKSAEYIASMNRDANAIGGLSVGEPHELMYELTDLCCSILPCDKPRYLMGVGTPENLLESISLGVDMFDCVMPTRNARNGMLFTWNGILSIKNKKWEKDFSPIDTSAQVPLIQNTSKAYLRHLMISGEYLGAQIASINNLRFYLELIRETRTQIEQGNFTHWKHRIIPQIMQRL